jgi:hypothetical protein
VKTLYSVFGYHETFSNTIIRTIDIRRNTKVLRNQAVQWSQFGSPIIFMAS